MLKCLSNNRAQGPYRRRLLGNFTGQAVMGEYVLVIFMVLAVIVGMTVYIKRSMQAKIHDARDYMISEVRIRTAGQFNGNLYKEYEPYYTDTNSDVYRYSNDRTTISGGGSTGVFGKTYDQTTTVTTNSQTLPPRDFDLTTPIN